ncbi:ATP-dependent DNA helicase [Aphis craccivora]|uniref:ATP-dependent DNA helicase n=1 Tax=Aphis craccivora TaxID=307492 RepID=A0A6G0YV11_APHCR|nr:ATP-dependent DNA helicase [Aphis craccivora]
MRNEALVLIEDTCVPMCGSLLSTLGMSAPNRSTHAAFNLELKREKDYDRNEQAEKVRNNVLLLNAEQKNVYDSLMKVVDDGTGDLKLRLLSHPLALLEGGRTTFSALKLPMNLLTVDKPTCTTTKNSATVKLMRECKIIIWDECTMAHKLALEAVDRTMKDLRGDSRRFGGAMILLSSDFRQKLPVIPKSTAADEINACLKSSFLWRHVKKLKLTTNMRVALQNDPSAAEFSIQLMALGYGQIPIDVLTGLISFLPNFCEFTSSKEELITKVFPSIEVNYKNLDWMSKRAILAARNKDFFTLNFTIQSKIAGELRLYKSVDSTTEKNEAANYPTEFLNSLDMPGTPPHNLQLKKLMNNVIQSTIIKGNFKGEEVLIPRIPIIPTDLLFQFKWIQIPVRLAFAMTINKSQSQSLEVCGINLEFGMLLDNLEWGLVDTGSPTPGLYRAPPPMDVTRTALYCASPLLTSAPVYIALPPPYLCPVYMALLALLSPMYVTRMALVRFPTRSPHQCTSWPWPGRARFGRFSTPSPPVIGADRLCVRHRGGSAVGGGARAGPVTCLGYDISDPMTYTQPICPDDGWEGGGGPAETSTARPGP